jgi:hypothetical protein
VCWGTPAIPVLRTLRQEGQEFEVSLGYLEKTCLKQTKRCTCHNRTRKQQKKNPKPGLLSKHEALCSNPNIITKKKKNLATIHLGAIITTM